MANDLTVHLVDDEEPSRRSLTFLLVSAGFAVRAHESAKAFLDVVSISERACVVVDLRMPHVDLIGLLERLRRFSSDIPAIVITGHGDVATAVQAMKAGATDCIDMPFRDDVLIAAINRATAVKRMSCATAGTENVESRLCQLTEREHEVLSGVLDGLQNKMIAFNLGISSRTVEVHRANVMAKMGARNLAELMRMVITVNGTAQPLANRQLRRTRASMI
ncbi:response regulator transcription factor [Rhizobium azibense]|uniref:Two-component system response regulator FixJ n=1 Tax=Rhizobium azibense TaxID=1136135 RepID=A0A4V2VFE4_9HYPH|nr:response regulator [Rhizobium azibense]TCU40095.1 two-component system response regulator FixJ [Rhizobium azibense]